MKQISTARNKSWMILQFGATWSNLGPVLAPHWILKGSPNRIFSYKINIKPETRMCRRCLEQIYFGDGFFMSKWEALIRKKKHFALYLLQNMSFLGIVKYREKSSQRMFQKLGASARIFDILERFRNILFFDDF